VTSLGITVYGCEQDEADLFRDLCPRFGVVPTITSGAVSEPIVISVPGNRCVSVGHKSEISASMLRALKDTGVEHVSTRSIGLNHIDLHAAAHLGITVENAAYAPDGVADYTLMLILMAIRNAKETLSSANRGDFRLRSVRGKELRDLTVGVVGVGNIGNAVIRRLQGFECRVLASSIRGQESAAEFVSLDELLLESDVVTLHLPLNAETHHLIGRRQIETMKPGSFLINTGRGALVDTNALIVALEEGTLGGAALDVLEGEEGLFYFDCTDRTIDNRLLVALQRLPNVIVTPHTAYYTRRALYDTVEQTLIKCRNFERSRGGA
jgi:D-specific alpha-keto acid dehydrogenase